MAVSVRAVLSLAGYNQPQPLVALNQEVLILLSFQDTVTGRPVSADDVQLIVRRPDQVGLDVSEDLTLTATGQYQISQQLTQAGTWVLATSCSLPAVASAQLSISVTASNGLLPAPAAPLIVTQDLAPVVTQSGGVLTAQRVTALPAPEALDPDAAVLAVQGGASVQATAGGIAALAAGLVTPASVFGATDAFLAAVNAGLSTITAATPGVTETHVWGGVTATRTYAFPGGDVAVVETWTGGITVTLTYYADGTTARS